MKTILCFGDSNTWGFTPGTGDRYSYEDRWTSMLQKSLGDGYLVVNEGYNGRTTAFDDPFAPSRNGLAVLPLVLETYRPIDLLVIMLGTNDTKNVFSKPVSSIVRGMQTLLEASKGKGAGPGGADPKILLIAPVIITPGDPARATFDPREFSEGPAKTRELPKEYAALAKKLGCYFLDSSTVAFPRPIDGLHFTKEAHRAFGDWISQEVPKLVF